MGLKSKMAAKGGKNRLRISTLLKVAVETCVTCLFIGFDAYGIDC